MNHKRIVDYTITAKLMFYSISAKHLQLNGLLHYKYKTDGLKWLILLIIANKIIFMCNGNLFDNGIYSIKTKDLTCSLGARANILHYQTSGGKMDNGKSCNTDPNAQNNNICKQSELSELQKQAKFKTSSDLCVPMSCDKMSKIRTILNLILSKAYEIEKDYMLDDTISESTKILINMISL